MWSKWAYLTLFRKIFIVIHQELGGNGVKINLLVDKKTRFLTDYFQFWVPRKFLIFIFF